MVIKIEGKDIVESCAVGAIGGGAGGLIGGTLTGNVNFVIGKG